MKAPAIDRRRRTAPRVGSYPKRFKNRTLRHTIARALCGRPGENGLDAAKVGDLGSHIAQMLLSPRLHLGTGLRATIHQSEQAAHLIEREAEFAGAKDKAKPRCMAFVVNAIASCGSRRIGYHADLLVISDGFEIAAGAPRQRRALQAKSLTEFHRQNTP
jgi:hypothetical protein